MKSYTDIEQSKKLAKILPLESADYCYIKTGVTKDNWMGIPEYQFNAFPHKDYSGESIGCWSLAALLDVLPKIDKYRSEIRHIDKGYCCCYTEENNVGDLYWYYADNPIDAAFEMVCWLLENEEI